MTRKLARVLSTVTVAALLVMTAPWAEAQAQADAKRSRLPAAVVKAIDENKPGAQIEKLTIENEAGVRFYDMEFKAGHGEMDVAEDGTVLDVSTIVQVNDLPEAVKAAVQRAALGTSIKQLTKSEVRARIEKVGGKGTPTRLAAPEFVYEVELAKGGEVEIAADGRILKGPKSLMNAQVRK
jgi:uncharacterized membrane protein YkoI